jgi:branched-chain amino acid transport system ATP-binding protein
MKGNGDNLLEIKNIQKDFKGVEVIRGVDLAVREKDRHAIIGPNGAGKTTLFHIITGNLVPSGGEIYYRGKEITRLPIHARTRLGISRSFQVTNLFSNLTVFDNILAGVRSKFGLRYSLTKNPYHVSELCDRTDGIIDRIDLKHVKNKLAKELPYGEQRALEVGIALSTDPQLILLDEPTAGMNKEGTKAFIKMIDALTKNVTLVIIEHDMDVVFTLASTLSVLHNGIIIASGNPEDVRKDSRVKDAYLGEE